MLKIKPNSGIGPISIGMSRQDVASAMLALTKNVKHTIQRDIYAKGKLVVDYQHEQVAAICINRDPHLPPLEPDLFGFNPLEIQAYKTIMRMSPHGIYDHEDPQLGMSYIYPKLGIYFWRDTTPETLEQEMKLGRTAEEKEHMWYQQALRDYQQFHVVGVFAAGYL